MKPDAKATYCKITIGKSIDAENILIITSTWDRRERKPFIMDTGFLFGMMKIF
jgi:hypothetical protein